MAGKNEELVAFSDAEAAKLVKLYQAAEKELINEVSRGIVKGNETTYVRGILANVKVILAELEQGSRQWSQSAIPAVYTKAIEEADAQMAAAHVAAGFGAIHQQAANILAQSTYGRLQDMTAFIGRRVDDLFRSISLASVRGTIVGYDSWQKAAKKIRDSLAENGITGFTDKAGRAWDMSTYADMVSVTTTMEAHLEGTRNRLLENDQQLVMVSEHGGSCRRCAPWEGRVLALDDSYDGDYPIDGTLDDARAEGLFHPRCRHAYGLYVPDLMDGSGDGIDENNADDFQD
jgi:hypothetical protein